MTKIKVFTCGGTIDIDRIQDDTYHFSTSHLTDIIKISNLKQGRLNIEEETIMLKDSRLMTKKDRKLVRSHCLKTPEKNIVILHGTDTMDLTAAVLGESDELKQKKTIVLTGAMTPFIKPRSDALFNFGCAIITAQSFSPGIYATMNGEIFNAGCFRKNKAKGIFEPTPSN